MTQQPSDTPGKIDIEDKHPHSQIPNPKSTLRHPPFFPSSWGPNFGESIRLFFPVA